MSVLAQSREERARELRAAGHSYRAIARKLDVSATTVRRILIPGYAERQRRLSREAKRCRTGICEECGGETRYNGTDGQGVSRLCADCGARTGGQLRRAATRGRGPVQVATLALLRTPKGYSEICGRLGITTGHASVLLHRLLAQGLIVRVSRGVYVTAESLSRGSDA